MSAEVAATHFNVHIIMQMLMDTCTGWFYIQNYTLQGNRLTEPGAVKAFRCQLPRYNKFYDSNKSDEAVPPQVEVASCA